MIDQTGRRLRLARRLRAAIACASLVALVTAGCGARVVVDRDAQGAASGQGGSGGHGASSGQGAGSGQGGAPMCGGPMFPPGLAEACLPLPAPCPAAEAPEVFAGMAEALGACAGNCCGKKSLVSVPCGPDVATKDGCCYFGKLITGTCP